MARKPKRKNPIAKGLREPKFRQRIVRDRTVYDRKRSKGKGIDAGS